MTDQSPLIVPMIVEALVVNDAVRTPRRQIVTFMRTEMTYGAMQQCGNGQPFIDDNDLDFTGSGLVPPNNVPASEYYNGVYLKWRLPRAYTHGSQDSVAGITSYRQVPNRWLVVRYSGPLGLRAARAWIIESDYLYPTDSPPSPDNVSQEASMYVQAASPSNPTPVGCRIGRNVALGSWTESGHTLNLTAMAPGNPAFAFYQPQCNNVFSFVDCLAGQPPETLSYLVIGWFSSLANDPLAPATPSFLSRLQALGWTLPAGTDPALTACWSLLCGSVNGVEWQSTTLPPGGAPGEAETPVSVAVGNTAVEALTAMIAGQSSAVSTDSSDVDARLLEAFQLDAVDVLDRPDGAAILAEKLRASCFQKLSGGYTWSIVDAPDANTPVSEQELATEAAWLAVLSRNQQLLDRAITQLASLQSRLYTMWWKYTLWPFAYQGSSAIPCLDDPSALQQQLDPTVPGSLVRETAQQMDSVKSLLAQVPSGSTPEALQQAIDSYARARGLPPTRQLKRSAAPVFYAPNNPVVLIAGAGASGILPAASSIECRFPSQLVTGFVHAGRTISAATPGLTIPQPDLCQISGVPWTTALVTSLVQEHFFLDPDDAAIIAAAVGSGDISAIQQAMSDSANDIGVLPDGAVQRWSQNPWHPLLLFWSASYYPIVYGTPEAPSWAFEGGQYTWNGSPASVATPPLGLGGLIQLTPSAALNMQARIRQLIANAQGLDPAELQAFQELLRFVQTSDDWDLLAQALDGFNEQLRLGTPGVFLSPGTTQLVTQPPLEDLIGDAARYPPGLPPIPMQGQAIPPSQFQPWRAGQFELMDLVLMDEWGQALWPFASQSGSYKTERVYLPPDLSPVLVSNPTTLTVASGPAIDAVVPALALASDEPLTLTVHGVGFAGDAVVQWNETALPTTFVSAIRLTAVIPADLLSIAGTATVTVADGGSTSPPATFMIAGGPAIGAIVPSLVEAGMVASDFLSVAVTGAGFADDAVVQWNGAALRTELVADDELVAYVPASSLFAPGTASVAVVSGGVPSNTASFFVSPGAAIASISPALALAGGSGFSLTVNGVGFEPASNVSLDGAPLATTFVSPTVLIAEVSAACIASAAQVTVTESVGAKVLANEPDPFIQLPPAVLQPARLDFSLISATDDDVVFGPENPGADPICGWVLPNHLDGSLMAYDPSGTALGEMSVGVAVSGQKTICWTAAPGSLYPTLQQLAEGLPHFGAFLSALGGRPPQDFSDFLAAIDETLWTTAPIGAAFDKSLSVLIGRPLAMIRARLQLLLKGPPHLDPSWQFTFDPSSCTPPATLSSPITSYQFAVELGNVAQLDDGLIGYYVGDDYDAFNVVVRSGAAEDGYLDPIGADGNYLYLPFDGVTAAHVSMLVDPRAPVHATTGILPVVTASLPLELTTQALAKLNVTFRANGILTDRQIPSDPAGTPTILMPVPRPRSGEWSWVEHDAGGWTTYATAPTDPAARLSNVPPVLRRGLLRRRAR